ADFACMGPETEGVLAANDRSRVTKPGSLASQAPPWRRGRGPVGGRGRGPRGLGRVGRGDWAAWAAGTGPRARGRAAPGPSALGRAARFDRAVLERAGMSGWLVLHSL